MKAAAITTELDLSKAADVVQHLATTPFACTRTETLSGGNANFTFRLYLTNPGEASRGKKTVVLKHAKGWSASSPDFKLQVERQDFEAFALQHVRAFLPDASTTLVTVPEVLLYDPSARIIIMEDAGETSETLKALLRRTSLPPGSLNRLCDGLGRFLAILHERGSKDGELMEKVGRNEEMRKITAWITYERVVPILRGDKGYEGILDPPLVEPASDGLPKSEIDRLEKLAETRMAQIYAAKDVFTMGDFWTGNVIVSVDPKTGDIERAYVVDWEVTKPGVPFLDFGQLAAELYTIGCFHAERKAEIDEGLRAYGRAYKEMREGVVDEEFVRGAGSHVGAHLAVITPTVQGWGTKEQAREVVKDGTVYLLKGIDGDMVYLRTSAVGGLLDVST